VSTVPLEDQMAAALRTFVIEADDLLTEMETGLLALESGAGPDSEEIVNALFRAVHTVKGSSGLFGLDMVVGFAHVVENVLDLVRAGAVPVTPALVGALLPCRDHLARLLGAVGEGRTEATPEETAAGETLLAALRPFAQPPEPAGAVPAPRTSQEPPVSAPPRTSGTAVLSLRFGPDCLRTGMDPLSFLRFLATLGETVAVECLDGLLPGADELDPEQCYLAFLVALRTAESREVLEGVFDFVRDESDIRVVMPDDPTSALTEMAASHGPLAGTVATWLRELAGELVGEPADDPDEGAGLTDGPSGSGGSRETGGPAAPGGDPQGSVPAETPGAPAAAGAVREPGAATPGAARAAAENRTVRVDADRLDRLIDAVGELVIAGAGAALHSELSGDEALEGSLGEVMRLVEEVRDGALQLRMVPIGTTFSRFQRVVRDVSTALGKDVALAVSGGDTEVDKALVEQIGDPLTHLVRNALDHGIEPAEVRAARGKPPRGTLRLNAFHDSGSIVIEVSDDGGGIDTEAVLAKGIERGLVDPSAVPSEKEIHALLFEPGFSTAPEVTDLSGRGVGMDVVKRNVAALRGTVDVESRLGEGTTMRIRLPLTLAIIDGFVVGVGGATFVVPLDRVVECVELPSSGLTRDCMDLRGEVLPFVRLRSHFTVAGEPARRENVVVVEYAGARTGLVVDTLKGEFQTVIKPLGPLFAHVQGVGGATILGNGDVALIIDVPVLVRDAGRQPVGVGVQS
jgi:two-component system chemotaxis sensor kinase CheA